MRELTGRQLQIVALLGVAGLWPGAIQQRLGIAAPTYHHHIRGAMKRMGAKTTWQLVYLAGLQIAQELEAAGERLGGAK